MSMSPEQIVLVQDSFEQLLPMADAAADCFYAQLFAAAPGLRSLFPADLGEQRRKFLVSLQAIVDALWRPEDLLAPLRDLGERHVGYGARPEHYAVAGEALLAALALQLGGRFGPETAAAWRAAYNLAAEAMAGPAAVMPGAPE